MLDRYWHGGTSRISPEAPVPVVRVDQIEDRPGGAANVALNIAALGAPAALVGVTGEDEAAESLLASLGAAGVDARFQRIAGQPTIVKLRVMSRHQQLLRMGYADRCGHQTGLCDGALRKICHRVDQGRCGVER